MGGSSGIPRSFTPLHSSPQRSSSGGKTKPLSSTGVKSSDVFVHKGGFKRQSSSSSEALPSPPRPAPERIAIEQGTVSVHAAVGLKNWHSGLRRVRNRLQKEQEKEQDAMSSSVNTESSDLKHIRTVYTPIKNLINNLILSDEKAIPNKQANALLAKSKKDFSEKVKIELQKIALRC
jgi:hypothetical protein